MHYKEEMEESRPIHVIIGAGGSCGTAVSYLCSRILLGEQETYCYDIDVKKPIKYGKNFSGQDSFVLPLAPDKLERLIVHICVPETAVEKALTRIIGENTDDVTFMIHSTMPPSITRKLKTLYNIRHLYYNPLFFREKYVESDMATPNRIVIADHQFKEKPVYNQVVEDYIREWQELSNGMTQIFRLTYEEAEVVKLATNAERATLITFFNGVNRFFEEFRTPMSRRAMILSNLLSPKNVLSTWEGGNWGLREDLIGKSYAGKCLPKDTKHLADYYPGGDVEGKKKNMSIFHAIEVFNIFDNIVRDVEEKERGRDDDDEEEREADGDV